MLRYFLDMGFDLSLEVVSGFNVAEHRRGFTFEKIVQMALNKTRKEETRQFAEPGSISGSVPCRLRCVEGIE